MLCVPFTAIGLDGRVHARGEQPMNPRGVRVLLQRHKRKSIRRSFCSNSDVPCSTGMNTARINLTVPREVHKAARIYAVQHGMTLAQVVTAALRLLLDVEQDKTASP